MEEMMNRFGLQWIHTATNLTTGKVEAIGTFEEVDHYIDFETDNDDDYEIDGHLVQVIRR